MTDTITPRDLFAAAAMVQAMRADFFEPERCWEFADMMMAHRPEPAEAPIMEPTKNDIEAAFAEIKQAYDNDRVVQYYREDLQEWCDGQLHYAPIPNWYWTTYKFRLKPATTAG
jgi:transposase